VLLISLLARLTLPLLIVLALFILSLLKPLILRLLELLTLPEPLPDFNVRFLVCRNNRVFSLTLVDALNDLIDFNVFTFGTLEEFALALLAFLILVDFFVVSKLFADLMLAEEYTDVRENAIMAKIDSNDLDLFNIVLIV